MKKLFIILCSIFIFLLLLCLFKLKDSKLSTNNVQDNLNTKILVIEHNNFKYNISSDNSSKILKILCSLQYSFEQSDSFPDYKICTKNGEIYLLDSAIKCVLHNRKTSIYIYI